MSAIAKSLPRGAASKANAGDKRKKQIVLAGGLIFVVLMVFQVMRLGGDSSSSAPASRAAAPVNVAAAVVPTSGAVTSGAGAALATAAPASRRALNKMPVRDPFVPLVPSTGPSGTGSAQASPPSAAVSPPPKVDASPTLAQKPASAPPISFSAPGAAPSKAAPLPLPTAALISINGSSQIVGRSKLFPAKAPAFRLVTVGRTFVRIAVAGGSFANGRGTITIRRGQRVTLENTATGVRYVLRFAAASSASAETKTTPAPSGKGDN